ncbi:MULTISPECIES: hypothetical protein [Streptomyces]|uniref:hypothetical protein n=1 Tax=Streptomyces TaxID=1883 RepID=UPI002F9122EF
MPQPVQLVQFDLQEQDSLLTAGQPKAIDAAMRAVTARIKKHLKAVAELASDKSVGASPEQLAEARTGIEASLAVLMVCPAGEVADLRRSLEKARELVDAALQIPGIADGSASPSADSPDEGFGTGTAAEYGLSASQ